MSLQRTLVKAVAAFGTLLTLATANATPPPAPSAPDVALLATGLLGATGSTIGPGGALYVTEGAAGRVSRIDPQTGERTTLASGLPAAVGGGLGGPIDVAFIGRTAYVLVTLVGPDVGGNAQVGIYRVDGPDSFTVIADIGAFSTRHPPGTPFFIPTGVQYAFDTYRGGFLVSDGHHNRVLRVGLDGTISELIAFDNIVPTGLAVSGSRVYLAEAGPVPHLAHDGKVVTFRPRSPAAREIAAGAPLVVDVAFGPQHRLYALSQGYFPPGNPEGSPALANTGALLHVDRKGAFTVVAEGLNQPTSLEFIGPTAYVVSLAGEVWRIEGSSITITITITTRTRTMTVATTTTLTRTVELHQDAPRIIATPCRS